MPPHCVHGPVVHVASDTMSGSNDAPDICTTSAGSFDGTHCEKSRLRTMQLASDGQHLFPTNPVPPHWPQ